MIAKDLGFIIKRINFRNTSVILNIYTRNYGKFSGIVKGFYTQRREYTSTCDMITLNEFIFYPKRSDIWLVSYVELINDFSYLIRDYNKYIFATQMVKLVDKGMMPEDKNRALFRLLLHSLYWMKTTDCKKTFIVFLVKFLTLSGFRPEFGCCAICGNGNVKSIRSFNVKDGGLICDRCRDSRTDLSQLRGETVKLIRYMQKAKFPYVLHVKPSMKSYHEIEIVLSHFVASHMDIDLPLIRR